MASRLSGDGRDVKDGVIVRQGIPARVIAEGPLFPQLAGVQVALHHDVRIRGNLHVHRLALHQFGALSPQKTGEVQLVNRRRKRRARRVDVDGVSAQGNRHLHARAHFGAFLKILRPVVMKVHVHARGRLVEKLHAVKPYVSSASPRVSRVDVPEGDVASRVLGPALDGGNRKEVRVFGLHDLLALGRAHRLGRERCEARELGQHLHLRDDALGRLDFEQFRHLVGHRIHAFYTESQLHALVGGVGVDEDGNVELLAAWADGFFEQKGGAAVLHRAIGDLGDLEFHVHRNLDAAQLARAL